LASAPRSAQTISDDPLADEVNQPSELDDLSHNEMCEIYRDAAANIRFAKDHQWKTVLYFSVGTVAVTSYCELTAWADASLSFYLLLIVWIFSGTSLLIVFSLQWWQAAEHRKIAYVTAKWSSFANIARAQKSKLISDIQRYGMMLMMALYLELVTIAVTRIFFQHV
jgi:hypothetical protein